MAELGWSRESIVLDSPAMACIAHVKNSLGQRRAPEESTKGPPSRVFKHDAPNEGTTSGTPPSCRSTPNRGFRLKTTTNPKTASEMSLSETLSETSSASREIYNLRFRILSNIISEFFTSREKINLKQKVHH